MAHSVLDPLLGCIRRSAEALETGPLTDQQLLERFLTTKDQSAFTALVRRHGGRVLAACRRVLFDDADVDDAFQATFLVLMHKAGSIRWQPSVGGWLCAVAHRVAVRARSNALRRRRNEDRAATRAPQAADPTDLSWREACAVLHEELDRLPEKYRLPVVLCYLEGRSRDEVAQELGWSAGEVKGRLERGRERLRFRLSRRGVTLSAGLLGAVTAPVQSAVPARLVDSMVSLVSSPTATAAAAGNAALLAQGVLRAMKLHQLKGVVTAVLLTGVVSVGLTLHGLRAQTVKPAQAPPADAPKVAAVPAPGKIAVQGRVLDPDGKPIAGARLYLPAAPKPGADRLEEADPLLQATAGPDGSFRFETEPTPHAMNAIRQLVAVAEGYGPDWADPTKPGPDGAVVLRLVPDDVPIRGRVVDLEGRPVAGARVGVVSLETTAEEDLTPVLRSWLTEPSLALQMAKKKLYTPRAAALPRSTPADANGQFEVRGVGRGRIVVLRIEGDAIEQRVVRAVARAGFDSKPYEPSAGARTPPGFRNPRPWPDLYGPEFVFSARPTQPVVGTVRDRATGKPLPNVFINASVTNGWWENAVYTRTDNEGRYRVVGLPKVPQRRLSFYSGEESPYLNAGFAVDDVEGLGSIILDVGLIRGVVVKGRVTEQATGKPVRGAGIRYNPLAGNSHFDKTPGTDIHRFASQGFSTDADGRFRLVVLPGAGLVTAQAETRGDTRSPYTQVRLDPADRPRAYLQQADTLGEAFLAADGHIETLMNQSAYKVIDPPAGADSHTIELQFDTGRSASGTVVDPDGKPLPGCTAAGLRATWDKPDTMWDKPDAVREAAFTAVALDPERPRTVAFLHKDRKLAGTVKMSGTEPTAPTVKLQPCGTVTGRVLDAEGKPVVEAKVTLYYRERAVSAVASVGLPGRQEIETDRDGRFRIDLVFPGQEFGIGFARRGAFLDAGDKLRKLTITPGEAKDLGDIATKPFGGG